MTPDRAAPFSRPNPHALATILEAGEVQRIIALRDIFDVSGTKLWARDQPVSRDLQRKLLDRQLRHPLEACLYAEDGVTSSTLLRAAEELLAKDEPLNALLHPAAARLLKELPHLPLHPVAQLLLTAGRASRPAAFTHALQAMALNGALLLARGSNTHELRIGMLAGLLHDLGEMYIAPDYAEDPADQALDFASYQQLVVHPHIGQLLLSQLTDYPPQVARAVGEHHERLDGTGYPRAMTKEALSPHGRLLAVTEAALGAMRGIPASRTRLAHASVALRVVPGEFDVDWIGALSQVAALEAADEPPEPEALCARLAALDIALGQTLARARALAPGAEGKALKAALELTEHLLARLRAGWNASGLWNPAAAVEADPSEAAAIEAELRFRLRGVARAAWLRAGELPPSDARRLQLLCESLGEGLQAA